MNDKPRVRFAPSPTGQVHIGNIRAAIYNWLFARRHGGCFLLRIEDTDLERSTPEAVQTLLDAMHWLGLDYDEAPLRQSRQIDRHREVADKMLADGFASRESGGPVILHLDGLLIDSSFVTEPRETVAIDVSKGELLLTPRGVDYITKGSDGREYHNPISRDAMPGLEVTLDGGSTLPGEKLFSSGCGTATDALGVRALSLRFRRRYVFYEDLVLGRLEKPLDSIRDMVVLRSDGTPVFHLANVVDDVTQGVTHILRGNDHVENTYRHLFIFRAMGIRPPRYGHFPMIVNAKGKPYSKRDGDAYVGDFRDKGYLPQCLVNFLALCGWGREDGVEVMTRRELVEHFDLARVSAAPARLNLEKLAWMNSQYLMRTSSQELLPLVMDELLREGVEAGSIDPEWLGKLIQLEQERAKTVRDFIFNTRHFFIEEVELDSRAVDKVLRKNNGTGFTVLEGLRDAFHSQVEWKADSLEIAAMAWGGECGLKIGDLVQPLRVAATGGMVSRGIWETLALLGRERTLRRMDKALAER
ncbi:MAG: glutamate--tRNA ligase [Planctomycetes bacterium]|nr:glutamate--tRNA ligase [Planctomycetota bacterium]